MTGKRPPTVGLTCTTIQTHRRPPRLGGNRAYVDALVRAGAAPLLIPHLTDRALLHIVYGLLDGLLLPGGEDLDPTHYGESRHQRCGPADLERDEVELTITRWAMDDRKPLLAICRGAQVLNVALGGSLYQDIQALAPVAEKHDWKPDYPRDLLSHTVAVTPHTRLAHIVGAASVPVNSLHHQAIRRVAPGLTVAACAPDQIVEAVEAEGHPFAIGVQWHPEELASEDVRAQRLFDALVDACDE